MRKDLLFHDVEQRTPAWLNLRRGKVTGSKASVLISKAKKTNDFNKGLSEATWNLIYDIVGDCVHTFDDEPDFGNFWTDRGELWEPQAVQAYQDFTFRETNSIGFIEWEGRRAGLSPDQLTTDNRGVEIKCLGRKHHIAAIEFLDYLIEVGKKDGTNLVPFGGKHYAQIQWALFVTDCPVWDFVHFHPYCGKKMLHVAPIPRDPEYIDRYAEVLPVVEQEIDRLIKKYQS